MQEFFFLLFYSQCSYVVYMLLIIDCARAIFSTLNYNSYAVALRPIDYAADNFTARLTLLPNVFREFPKVTFRNHLKATVVDLSQMLNFYHDFL